MTFPNEGSFWGLINISASTDVHVMGTLPGAAWRSHRRPTGGAGNREATVPSDEKRDNIACTRKA